MSVESNEQSHTSGGPKPQRWRDTSVTAMPKLWLSALQNMPKVH